MEIGNDWTFSAPMELTDEQAAAFREQLAVINGGLAQMNSGGVVRMDAVE